MAAAAPPPAAAAEGNAAYTYSEIWARSAKIHSIFTCMQLMYATMLKHIPHTHYKFYTKGGNTLPLLKSYYSIPTESYRFPSDFDLTFLANPGLAIEHYNYTQAVGLDIVLDVLNRLCHINSLPGTAFFNPEIQTESIIRVEELGRSSMNLHPNPDLTAVFGKYNGRALPKGCPFEIIVRPNTVIPHILDVGMVTLRLRHPSGDPRRSLELLDVSFMLRGGANNDAVVRNLRRDWEMTELVLIDGMPIYDPMTAFVNMHIAARGNTRPNKRARRLTRANNLRTSFGLFNNNARKRTRRNAMRAVLGRTDPSLLDLFPPEEAAAPAAAAAVAEGGGGGGEGAAAEGGGGGGSGAAAEGGGGGGGNNAP